MNDYKVTLSVIIEAENKSDAISKVMELSEDDLDLLGLEDIEEC